MKYLYMNERIRQKRPRKPVIVCQNEDGSKVESNLFCIRVPGLNMVIGTIEFDPKGLDVCKTHDVKAWVEFHDAIEIIPMRDAETVQCGVAQTTEHRVHNPAVAGSSPAPATKVASAKLPNRRVQFE
jgi:hypothetical protein